MESRKITAGPSKFDLMLSLFEKDKTVRCTVEGQEVEVTVLGIEAEDNSRESWNLVGYVLGIPQRQGYRAYYSTLDRQGQLWLTDK